MATMVRAASVKAAAAFFCVTLAIGGSVRESAAQDTGRPKVGVALGGGSARGLAHIGVLRWFEEHRIPIDLLTGTSMGGLIGGAYATGMTPDEIETLLTGLDWDTFFGASRFEFLNARRKRDWRAYPSRLEFGLKGGIVPPPSLNNGQQVELLLSRIAAAYYGLASFDELPTPFRCVAVDLKLARPVILRDGSLARAMRATMSMPLVFPPVLMDEQVLVDGGALNNIPADVAREMGAARVVAVNVGELGAKASLDYTLVGLVTETLDAMIRENARRASASADIIIDVPLQGFGPLDWRRTAEFSQAGYAAAEAMRTKLLPLAIGEAEWAQWQASRAKARRRSLPVPAFVTVAGAAVADAESIQRALAAHVGVPFDLASVEAAIRDLGGLDRYETLSWELVTRGPDYGLAITARPKSYGPPFVFLGVSLENATGNEFHFGIGGRYLAFDVLGSGSELRLDVGLGSDPLLAGSWYRPLGTTPLFVEPFAGVGAQTFSVIEDGRTTASYRRTRVGIGVDAGVNAGQLDEVRAGVRYGWTASSVRIGDPGLPQIDGEDASLHLRWVHDGQDDPVVPSRGIRTIVELRHILSAPFVIAAGESRTSEGVSQAEVSGSWLKSLNRGATRRIFAGAGGGTSFGGQPLPTDQFSLGGPLRMSGFSAGESRGNHFAFGAAGYLQQVTRLPDFLGGRVFLGGWLETGAAFDHRDAAEIDTHTSAALVADTLIGPVFGAASIGMDGDTRFYIGIGRIFR